MTCRIRISFLLDSESRTYLSRVTLEFRELREIVRREIKLPNRAFSENLVKRLWFAIDVDDDGTITRDEFTRFMLRAARGERNNGDNGGGGEAVVIATIGGGASSELADFISLVNERASKLRVVDLIARRLNAQLVKIARDAGSKRAAISWCVVFLIVVGCLILLFSCCCCSSSSSPASLSRVARTV